MKDAPDVRKCDIRGRVFNDISMYVVGSFLDLYFVREVRLDCFPAIKIRTSCHSSEREGTVFMRRASQGTKITD